MAQYLIAPRIAPTRSVVTPATRMIAIVPDRACRVTMPMPNRTPQLTCVVETGSHSRLAPLTIIAVNKFAVNSWP